jgi:hypothetical protein
MKHASSSGGSDSEEKSVHGYLVEVTPGRELLYRTPWAFREAMRIGQITAESRIFHRATSQWISITEHPEYRKFISARAPLSRPVVKPGPAAPSAGSPVPSHPADARTAPAAPTRPISQKAAKIYQRMTSGLTELKRRLETAKPQRSVAKPQPRASKAPAVAPTSAKTPPAKEAGPAPQSSPEQSGPRKRWTFYP